MVDVASVLCPVTESVPLEERDEVAVIEPIVADPPVSVEMTPVTALKSVAKRLDELAFVLVRFPIVEEINVGVSVKT